MKILKLFLLVASLGSPLFSQANTLRVNPTDSLGALREKLERDPSIFADPLYLNSAARDFRLDPKSPNRNAGANGAAIGALSD